MDAHVLVVDDEVDMLVLLRNYLTREGYEVTTAPSAEVALQCLAETHFDVVLTDFRMRGMDGLELVRETHATHPDTQLLLMTAFGSLDTAIDAIKAGAYYFLTKPVKLPELGTLVRKALSERELRRENRQLRRAVEDRYAFGQLLGKSALMQRLFRQLERLAATTSTVLIQGESGTGKELVAQALHYHSPRRRHAFVPINCAALPEGLLESELFGHTKGAFTGAQVARRGLFVEASRGTLFLDEIADLPLGMQAKLLRALEQRRIRPVGSDQEVEVDVRVLAATNQDVEAAVQHGTFREDLFYRVKVLMVRIPPLREHREDIAFLAETFLHRQSAEHHLPPRRFTPAALRRLEHYAWPGNVRELAHVIERAVILSAGEWIDVEELGLDAPPRPRPEALAGSGAPGPLAPGSPPGETFNLDATTQHLVVAALEKTRHHKAQAAALLGVHPRTLTRMLRRYGLPDAP
jgi:DNA-binding NtrC family response regulator